ncbi:MAG: hypothetical protein IT363_11975 [Methanoregulaceae archaeon]|nr:hypothetical protein [Methanoregulaceae archaeon]
MNLINETERNFVNALVDGTQNVLVTSRLSKSEKLDTLQRSIRVHAHYAKRLRLALARSDASVERSKIERLLRLREAAVNYLVSMARWLVSQEQHEGSLRQRPRMFSEPRWSLPSEPKTQ